MGDENSEKIAFRLRHLVPRNLVSSFYRSHSASSEKSKVVHYPNPDGSEEFEFQLTWGKFAAKAWGPVDGRPVFAIHGWLDNAGSFDLLIPLLPKNLRIVAVDIPGQGFSDHFPPDIAYNFLDCLLAIERLAKYFEWETFSFIAHSFGGCVAMMYSGIYPHRVEKIVQLDIFRATPTIPETVDVRIRKTVSKLLKYEEAIISGGPEKPITYDEAVEKCVTGTFGSMDESACHVMFRRGLKKIVSSHGDEGYVFSRDRRLLTAPLGFIPKEDMLIFARKMTADVLLIKYKDGPLFESLEAYQEHLAALRESRAKIVDYVEVEGQHHTHLTNPELVAPFICDFFNA